MIVGSSECTEFPQDPKLMGPAPRVARCHKHGSLWKLGETQNSPVSSVILCDGVNFGLKVQILHPVRSHYNQEFLRDAI